MAYVSPTQKLLFKTFLRDKMNCLDARNTYMTRQVLPERLLKFKFRTIRHLE